MSPTTHAALLMERSAHPVVLVGPGSRGALHAIDMLARRLGAAILTTPQAKSQVDETRPDAGGVFSFGANADGKRIVESADLIVAFGTDCGEFVSRGGAAFLDKRVVQVVDHPEDVAVTLTPDVVLVGALRAAAETLGRSLSWTGERRRWFAPLCGGRTSAPPPYTRNDTTTEGMDPTAAVRAIEQALPRHVRLACDVTSATLHLLEGARLTPEQRFWCNIERSACMGTAIAAGIGLRTASHLPTLVVIGDWGLCMAASELHTVASLPLANFVIVVWSNAGGALIRSGVHAQQIAVPPSLHTWERPPRFEHVARGWGLRALTVRKPRALRRVLERALRAYEPVLIDARIDPEAAAPAADRYLYLDATASVR